MVISKKLLPYDGFSLFWWHSDYTHNDGSCETHGQRRNKNHKCLHFHNYKPHS